MAKYRRKPSSLRISPAETEYAFRRGARLMRQCIIEVIEGIEKDVKHTLKCLCFACVRRRQRQTRIQRITFRELHDLEDGETT